MAAHACRQCDLNDIVIVSSSTHRFCRHAQAWIAGADESLPLTGIGSALQYNGIPFCQARQATAIYQYLACLLRDMVEVLPNVDHVNPETIQFVASTHRFHPDVNIPDLVLSRSIWVPQN